MPLPPHEFSIWIPGVPRSLQASRVNKHTYVASVQAAARAVCPIPLGSSAIEIVLLFVERAGQRPDVDNVLKPALDALKGIVYADDRQIRSVRAEAVTDDPSLRDIDGVPHATFRQLLDGTDFLIRVRVPPTPSIARDLGSS